MADGTIAPAMPTLISKEGKAAWALVAHLKQYKIAKQEGSAWPERMGNRSDIMVPPSGHDIASYPDDPRIKLPVRVPKELYNNGNLDILTIFVFNDKI